MLDEQIVHLIKNLITQLSGFTDDSEPFKEIEKHVFRNVQMADSLYFCNRTEIDSIVQSLVNKFTLHGFTKQSKRLQYVYEKLVPNTLRRQELAIRLNVVKFLLGVSQSPTNNFHKYWGNVSFQKGDSDNILDWYSYLQEGIPKWSPPPDEDNDSWSSSDDSIAADGDAADYCSTDTKIELEKSCEEEDILLLYRNSKSSLSKTVQCDWFNSEQIVIKPPSEERDANIAILWNDFINDKTWGLFSSSSVAILTEYKIMREILWQFYEPHTCSSFKLLGDKVVPSENVTISSVRNRALQVMLNDIIPYINWLDVFRDFHDSLINTKNNSSVIAPDTYKSYNYAVQCILTPIFNSLREIEDNIKCQEDTTTLLTLANKVRLLFNTVKVLYSIHSKVILDFNHHSSFKCATTLLWRLRSGLLYTSSKLEHDLYLTLYLQSLYKYFTIINSWLSRDDFEDPTEEFIISDENPKDPHVLFSRSHSTTSVQADNAQNTRKTQRGDQDWHMQFTVKDVELTPSDSILDIICTQILQIGKNIHLLRLLGKLHLLPEFTGKPSETLYKAFVRRVLERIEDFFNPEEKSKDVPVEDNQIISASSTFIFPAICPDGCKYFTEMDKLENLVDTSDGFLIKAFESFFVKKPEYKSEVPEKSLFEKVSEVAVDFFPSYEFVEDVFVTILKERYIISGIMVKNVLINDYHLEKQFSFLKHIYLFEDDLIFPVYRHIFDELNNGSIWMNRAQLTSHLQDIIMDIYPNFYDECIIDIKDNCKDTNEPLKACGLVNINYKIPWPVNIILRDEHILMYKELFQFILKIKWALYTLNHMYFSELVPKAHMVKNLPKAVRHLTVQLKILRFGLVNVFSSIQHYVLGHIFTKHLYTFKKAFEEAYDLESLITTHSDFIQSLHKEVLLLRDYDKANHGILLLLYVVTQLWHMWSDLPGINQTDLNRCVNWYLLCQQNIDPVLNPTSYYNFVSKD